MSLLGPDRYFSRLSKIDIDRDLLAPGYKFVLLDIDNTILSRETHEVPRDVGHWLAKARTAGLSFCLVSNNWHESVYQLANRLSLPIVAKAVKPLPPAFLMALRKLGATRKETVVIGDQLVTDVLGAHFLGMRAYLLAPLVEQDLPHTLLLRNFERAVMGDRQPEGATNTVAKCVESDTFTADAPSAESTGDTSVSNVGAGFAAVSASIATPAIAPAVATSVSVSATPLPKQGEQTEKASL